MFEDAEDEVGGALARANMTAMITTTMTANPFRPDPALPNIHFLPVLESV